jgi:hypothetical protein
VAVYELSKEVLIDPGEDLGDLVIYRRRGRTVSTNPADRFSKLSDRAGPAARASMSNP